MIETRHPGRIAGLLIAVGFGFDPLAGEEASTLGRLTILQARIWPDLPGGLTSSLGNGGTPTPVVPSPPEYWQGRHEGN
jgi:hypothetical protein